MAVVLTAGGHDAFVPAVEQLSDGYRLVDRGKALGCEPLMFIQKALESLSGAPSFVFALTVLRFDCPGSSRTTMEANQGPSAFPSIGGALAVHSLAGHERSSPSFEVRRRC